MAVKANKGLTDKQTQHPVPEKPYDQKKVSGLLLEYETKLDTCRAKEGL